MIDVITRSMAANYKGIVFDWLKEASTRPASIGRAAIVMATEPVSKGAASMQHGVQRHGDELDTIQQAAIDRMLAENEEDKT